MFESVNKVRLEEPGGGVGATAVNKCVIRTYLRGKFINNAESDIAFCLPLLDSKYFSLAMFLSGAMLQITLLSACSLYI